MQHQKESKQPSRHYLPLILGLCFLLVGISVSIFHSSAGAAQATLAWDAASGVAGYKIYHGTTSSSYSWVVDVGNSTTYTYTNLPEGSTYYFAATAYDSSGLESDFSDEVNFSASAVPCTYAISPANASFGTSGGTGTVAVTTQSGCSWTASTGVSWITVTSGASGTGSGTVAYTVASNSSTSRTAVSTIAGRLFTFSQTGVASSFTITASAGTGGTISPVGSVSANYGTNRTFTIAANSGYAVSNVTVDGVSVGAVTSYTLSNVTANHSIAATFSAAGTYALTVTKAGTGTGTVTTSPTGTSFRTGTVVTLTATPNASSTFAGWSGACSGTSTTCQVTMSAARSVTATFTLRSYTITASAGAGGTISPVGSVNANYGTNQTFTIAANSGYAVSRVTVGGVSVGAITSYAFNNVTANHTITATFSTASTYALTVTKSGTGTGTVTTSPSGTSFTAGTVVTLTAAASAGSTFTGWSGACTGTATTCQVTMSANRSVTASFSAGNGYTLSITKAGTGTGTATTSPTGTSFAAGTPITVTATPDAGCTFTGWSGDYSGTAQTVQGTMPASNVRIIATFTRRTVSITSSAGTGGSISPSGSVNVNYGASQTFLFTPSTGFKVRYVIVDGIYLSARSSYTFSNIIGNHTIRALFTR